MIWLVMWAAVQMWWLLVGHAVADYALQSPWMSSAKRRPRPSRGTGDPLAQDCGVPWQIVLSAHSLIHGGATALATRVPLLGAFEAMAHFVIDFGRGEGWYGLYVDQALHVACKVLWVVLFALYLWFTA